MPFYTPSKATFSVAGQEFPRVTWYKTPGMRGLYIKLMFVILTSATNGYDGSMMNGLQTLTYWQTYFKNPDAPQLGLLNAIMSVGSIVALPVVPYIADGLGRRTGVMIGCVIMMIGVVLQSAAVNFAMFVASRFLIGFGVAIAHGASPLLLTELVHPQHRAIYTTIYNCSWYFGSIIAAWLTFGTLTIKSDWSWRIPSMVQAVPSILQFGFIWFVPESPRYLIAKGKDEKALRILANAHAQGNEQDEMVQLEYNEIRSTIKLEQEFESNGWSELWRTKGNRHRLIILISLGFFSQFSGNGLVSYYIGKVLSGVGITNPTTQNLINGILNIYNWIVALTMCFFVDKVGRRPLFLAATAIMLAAFIAWTICAARWSQTSIGNPDDKDFVAGDSAAGNAEIAFIFLFYTGYNLAWSGLLVAYSVEILPYNIRAKGMNVLWLAIDLALFFNNYVNPIAMAAIGWKYYLVYTVWLAFELFVVWKFYIETKNTPLEEIVKYFDGEGAILGGAAGTEKSRQLAAEMGEGTGPNMTDDEKTVHVSEVENRTH